MASIPPHTPNDIPATNLDEGASVVLKLDASGNLRFNLQLPEDEGTRSVTALAFLAGLSDIFSKNILFGPAAQALLDRIRLEALALATSGPVAEPGSVTSRTLH
ncbi:hypothetical protein [Acidithiobacillus thiooxidans]|uniref:hypothetical protein n=1 Tax=Acidithiobacillus thiooxidans TaxID=930 RepID=UPI000A5D6844|nr:hypothetical protein [Acidithiobacillus thiooxidans]